MRFGLTRVVLFVGADDISAHHTLGEAPSLACRWPVDRDPIPPRSHDKSKAIRSLAVCSLSMSTHERADRSDRKNTPRA